MEGVMRSRVATFIGVFTVALVWVTPAALAQQTGTDIPRTSDGWPDLSGIYDTATLTPLQRPERYGNTLFLTEEEAAEIEEREPQAIAEAFDIPTERNDTNAVPAGNERSHVRIRVPRGELRHGRHLAGRPDSRRRGSGAVSIASRR